MHEMEMYKVKMDPSMLIKSTEDSTSFDTTQHLSKTESNIEEPKEEEPKEEEPKEEQSSSILIALIICIVIALIVSIFVST